ncbi:hypothetical protein GCM10009681_34990 [Luedemannella helvata]|uniref:Type I restriction modification DNA specificity domain-containing protein n=2 Tax=Luedemannella helvata TaxID=349315 RepID=A0ABP4WUS0_9ACTN
MRNISQTSLQAMPLAIPPLGEQRRIVDILEDYLSRLDAASGNCDSNQLKTVGLKRSLWQQVFAVRAEDQQWQVASLLDVARIANGQTPKGLTDRLVSTAQEDCIPFYKVGDMNLSDGRFMSTARFYVRKSDATLLGLHVRTPGTVLLPKRGGAIATNKKRILQAEAAYDLNTMGLEPSERVHAEFLWHWLQGIDLSRLADGSNVPQINAPQIRDLRLPLPPLEIQQEVLVRMDKNLGALNRLNSDLEHVQRKAAALRSALLATAFSGRLTGRASDMDLVGEMAGV